MSEECGSDLALCDRRAKDDESFFNSTTIYDLSSQPGSRIRGDWLWAYSQFVRAFVLKGLTQKGDILNAFSGILERFGPFFGGFVSGIPLQAISWTLLWTYHGREGCE